MNTPNCDLQSNLCSTIKLMTYNPSANMSGFGNDLDWNDPDDIIHEIDEEDEDACIDEFNRLNKKKKGLLASYNESRQIINNIIEATRGANGALDRSEANKSAIQRAREKLELRYERYQKLCNRQLTLCDKDTEEISKENCTTLTDTYHTVITALTKLMIELQPQNQGAYHNEGDQAHLKPIQALKPSFILSFDNSPTELAAWALQFRSYFDASRLHNLPFSQQQAFLRQGLNPDVWTAIQHKVNNDTRVFRNPLDLDEVSCEEFIEDAFQIRYPLIMRRYKFFTYERKGNQTFTNFSAKLRELAAAAQLEQMGQNDYLVFRIIAGINDSHTADKLLSIPQADFNLEEINRVAVACEAAKNYSDLNATSENISNQVQNSQTPRQKLKGILKKSANEISYKDFQHLTGAAKITALKEHGFCVRCGEEMHLEGEKCLHQSTKCHNCGCTGHISKVCAK